MTIVSINSCNFGSTGNIMIQISETARKQGYKAYICCPLSRDNEKKKVEQQIYIGSRISRNIHLKLSELTGYNGCFSIFATLSFIKKLKRISPDIIHLHNLHNCYINLPILFKYIKSHDIKIVWTLHDCWAFTGQCPYFDLAKCDRWKTGCGNCSQFKLYPRALVDKTSTMWKKKKKWFTNIHNMIVVTPSYWLHDLVKKSYLKGYPVKVINNGIDLNIFKPTTSDFRKEYNITAKYIVLGVSFDWGKRKGLDVITELAKRLSMQYQIVLVGTDDGIDKQLPSNIISIHKTHDQNELAGLYSAADVFVNPTREDNYPTVNMEAIACGTPVVTFKTGGSPEIPDSGCGSVILCDDIDSFEAEIIRICTSNPFSTDNCVKRAKKCFDMNIKFQEYVKLYRDIIEE